MPAQEKTEKPTPRRRREARKKGQVAKSQELNNVAIILAATLFFLFMGKVFFSGLSQIMKGVFSDLYTLSITEDNFFSYLTKGAVSVFKIFLPIVLVLMVAGIIIGVAQTGLMFTFDSIAPKFDRINPIKGAQKLFSRRGAVEVVKALFKVGGVSYLIFSGIRGNMAIFSTYTYMDVDQILVSFTKILFSILFKIIGFLLIVAILDYIFQKFDFEKSIMMTKQEVKDEFKQTEGDPQVKSRIRSMQRQLARQRMMQEVPKAKVVITNPTHIAVALKYDNGMRAPEVVAKGVRLIAEKIKEVAEKYNIPIVENPPLARELYEKVEIGEQIPPELYKAVAEVLAYIYKLEAQGIRS